MCIQVVVILLMKNLAVVFRLDAFGLYGFYGAVTVITLPCLHNTYALCLKVILQSPVGK